MSEEMHEASASGSGGTLPHNFSQTASIPPDFVDQFRDMMVRERKETFCCFLSDDARQAPDWSCIHAEHEIQELLQSGTFGTLSSLVGSRTLVEFIFKLLELGFRGLLYASTGRNAYTIRSLRRSANDAEEPW